MFRSGGYDLLNITVPAGGMNQNVTPEALSNTQTYWLENILPEPLGQGKVRHGTAQLAGDIADVLDPTWVIQEVFHYTTYKGEEQLLLYVQCFDRDDSVKDLQINDDAATLVFDTDHAKHYVVGTPIKLYYQLRAQKVFCPVIREVVKNERNVTLHFDKSEWVHGMEIEKTYYSSGRIYCYDFASKKLDPRPKSQGLAVNSVPRSVIFKEKLLICNGIDNVLYWDGETINNIYCWVPWINNSKYIKRKSAKEFAVFGPKLYLDNKLIYEPQEGELIRFKINEKIFEVTIESWEIKENTWSFKIKEDLPDFVGNQSESDVWDLNKINETEELFVYGKSFPPKLSYMKVMHNRIWGFGEGAVSLEYRKEPMKVYFSYVPESLTDWYSDVTQTMPYINMDYEQGRYDNFEAIVALGDNVAFMGRHNTQIWQGKNPLNVNGFQWRSTIEGGVIHGNLVQAIGNDVFFASSQGIMSFSTLNVAKQFAISPLDAMNPFVQDCFKQIANSNSIYQQCRSFTYTGGSFAGFKIGANETIIALANVQVYSFSLFSGVFKYAQAFNTIGGKLLLAVRNKVLEYKDRKSDLELFTDDGHPVSFIWSLPIVRFDQELRLRKFACKYFEVGAEYSSAFAMENAKSIRVSINGTLEKAFDINTRYPTAFKGDILNTIPLYNDTSAEFRLSVPHKIAKVRMKFVSTSFWGTLHGQVKTGPFIIKNMAFYGRIER